MGAGCLEGSRKAIDFLVVAHQHAWCPLGFVSHVEGSSGTVGECDRY